MVAVAPGAAISLSLHCAVAWFLPGVHRLGKSPQKTDGGLGSLGKEKEAGQCPAQGEPGQGQAARSRKGMRGHGKSSREGSRRKR